MKSKKIIKALASAFTEEDINIMVNRVLHLQDVFDSKFYNLDMCPAEVYDDLALINIISQVMAERCSSSTYVKSITDTLLADIISNIAKNAADGVSEGSPFDVALAGQLNGCEDDSILGDGGMRPADWGMDADHDFDDADETEYDSQYSGLFHGTRGALNRKKGVARAKEPASKEPEVQFAPPFGKKSVLQNFSSDADAEDESKDLDVIDDEDGSLFGEELSEDPEADGEILTDFGSDEYEDEYEDEDEDEYEDEDEDEDEEYEDEYEDDDLYTSDEDSVVTGLSEDATVKSHELPKFKLNPEKPKDSKSKKNKK